MPPSKVHGPIRDQKIPSRSNSIWSGRSGNPYDDVVIDRQTLPISLSMERPIGEDPGYQLFPAEYDSRHIAIDAVDLRIRQLMVSVPPPSPPKWTRFFSYCSGKKSRQRESPIQKVLDNVNIDVPAGSLAAIIGASGSGKTTLLNTIAERTSIMGMVISGTITFNWRNGISSTRSGYVRQQDLLIPTLTVRETLYYAAKLRQPSNSPAELDRIVQETIKELDLEDCAQNQIRRCSGGEKRRTSIGCQLLGNPSILLVDEATTGLDATSALAVITTLQKLARKGHTIITTIHQPRAEIFSLFDEIIVMCKGSPIYSGRADQCLGYFAKLGYKAPRYANPTEFIINLSAIDYRSQDLENASKSKVAQLVASWNQTVDKNAIPRKSIATTKSSRTHHRIWLGTVQLITTLIRRNFLLIWRDKVSTGGALLIAALLGVAGGLINLMLPRDLSGIRSREGALYTGSNIICVVYFELELFRLAKDVRVFDQEREDRVSNATAFVLSRRLAYLLVEDVPVPLIFSAIFYYMTGLRSDFGHFIIFFVFIFIASYTSRAWAMVAISLSRDYSKAKLAGGLYQIVQIFSSGFFIQASRIPVYVSWLRWLAYLFYAFGGLSSNEFSNEFYDCPVSGGEQSAACRAYQGDETLKTLGLWKDWIGMPLGIITAFAVAYIVLAIVLLSFKPVSRARAGNQINTASGNIDRVDSPQSLPIFHIPKSVEIGLSDVSIHSHTGLAGLYEIDKCLVRGTSITFPPASLSVIMGPSGSGKTTLLKAIAGRDQSLYSIFGKIMYNGESTQPNVARSICSYVSQSDEGLLSTMTVSETLRFAALLRLPRTMSQAQKFQRAEEIMLEVGLKDCASTAVGDETTKGISGGERRRLSIGIQLLNEPLVMVLDEPTSGLDSATASSIVSLLRDLADSGRTILASIHQAGRAEFDQFDNIILLAKGGHTCYAGPRTSMLPYFQPLGHYCRTTKSPADFALDLLNGEFGPHPHAALPKPIDRAKTLIDAWARSRHWIDELQSRDPSYELFGPLKQLKRSPPSFWTSYTTLLHRSFLHHYRKRHVLRARFSQVCSYGVLLTLFFAPLKFDQPGIQTIAGYIFLLSSVYTMGLQQNTVVYPEELSIFSYEYKDKASSTESFFAQYATLELPYEIASSLVFNVLTVFAVGLPRTFTMYIVLVYNTCLLLNCGESFGIIFFTIFNQADFALTAAILGMYVVVNSSGIITPNVPSFIRALNYASPMFHSVSNLMPFALRGAHFSCTAAERSSDGTCPMSTGEAVLDLFKFNVDPERGLLGLLITAISYRLIAYALLKIKLIGLDARIRGLLQRCRRQRQHAKTGASGQAAYEMI